MADNKPTISAKARYDKLSSTRAPVLDRARLCADLTIPSLLTLETIKDSDVLATPYQSQGARGVNNLSNKLLTTLFPPNSPFFQLTIDKELVVTNGWKETDVEKTLSEMEGVVMSEMEREAYRIPIYTALRLLVSTGNSLLYKAGEKEGSGIKVFNLNQYVVDRDPMGRPLEIIVKERVAPIVLPEDIRVKVMKDQDDEQGRSESNYVDLYTRVVRGADKWEVYQEVSGEIIESTRGEYDLEDSPWIPLRWSHIPGEDYGRGITEEYLGDLRTLEALSQAMAEGTAAAAKILLFVDPASMTTKKEVANANNLEVLEGNAADVTALTIGKQGDFQTVIALMEVVTKRLSYAFLLNSSVQRSGERVTAEEIRYMAGELEDALGGVYSILSQELQLPILRLEIKELTKSNKLPTLGDKGTALEPMITTGIDGLGRGHDLNKLEKGLEGVNAMGPEGLALINKENYLKQWFAALGLSSEELLTSQAEVSQGQQQQQMMQMAQNVAPGVAQEVAKGAMAQAQVPQDPSQDPSLQQPQQ